MFGSNSGQTPLVLACKYGNDKCVELLLNCNVQLLTEDNNDKNDWDYPRQNVNMYVSNKIINLLNSKSS